MKFKNPFNRKQKATPQKLQTVYTDKFGNEWKQFTNQLDLPATRAIAAEIATKHTEFNITPDLFKQMIGLMKEHANKGEIVELFHLLEEIEIRTEMIGEEQTLLELACCYYLLNDENPEGSGNDKRLEKLRILDQDNEAKNFFLRSCFEITKEFSNISGADIIKYLKEQQPITNRLQRLISKRKLKNTLIR